MHTPLQKNAEQQSTRLSPSSTFSHLQSPHVKLINYLDPHNFFPLQTKYSFFKNFSEKLVNFFILKSQYFVRSKSQAGCMSARVLYSQVREHHQQLPSGASMHRRRGCGAFFSLVVHSWRASRHHGMRQGEQSQEGGWGEARRATLALIGLPCRRGVLAVQSKRA